MQIQVEFPKTVREEIRDAVGADCSAPYCGRKTDGWDQGKRKRIYKGEAAHICGAKPLAPRYSELPPDMDRHGPENGIWLCADCHTMVDRFPAMYPAQVLWKWKEQAEANHQLGYHRAFDRPLSVNLRDELDKAYSFLEQVKPAVHGFMEAIAARPLFTTFYPISEKTVRTMRQLAGLTIGPPSWGNRHPFWTFTFYRWQDELVRLAGLLCYYPQFHIFSDRLVNWAHTVYKCADGATEELIFHSREAADIYLFKQQYERFSHYVLNFKG